MINNENKALLIPFFRILVKVIPPYNSGIHLINIEIEKMKKVTELRNEVKQGISTNSIILEGKSPVSISRYIAYMNKEQCLDAIADGVIKFADDSVLWSKANGDNKPDAKPDADANLNGKSIPIETLGSLSSI